MIKTVPTFVTLDGRSHLDPDRAIAHERHVQVVNVLLVERHSLELDLSDVEKTAKAICLTQHQVQMIFGVDHTGALGLHRGGVVAARPVVKDPRLAMPYGRMSHDLPARPGGPIPNSVEANQTVERGDFVHVTLHGDGKVDVVKTDPPERVLVKDPPWEVPFAATVERPWPPSDMRDETGHVSSPLGKAVNEIVDKIEEQRRAHPTTGLLPHPDSPEGRRRALRQRPASDPMDKLLAEMAAELTDPVRYADAG